MTDWVAREKETGISREKEKELRKKPASMGFVLELMSSVLADHIKKRESLLQGKAVQFNRRMKSFEDRLEALEDKPGLTYEGVWTQDRQYNEGDFVTHDGSVWYAKCPTRGKPGASRDFVLAVKRGRDAK